MRDDTAESGVVSKEDFQNFLVREDFLVREIIDKNQKKHRANNTALRNSSLDRKRK